MKEGKDPGEGQEERGGGGWGWGATDYLINEANTMRPSLRWMAVDISYCLGHCEWLFGGSDECKQKTVANIQNEWVCRRGGRMVAATGLRFQC